MSATATPAGGLTAEISRIEKVKGKAGLPGEIAGPALRVTVRVRNSGQSAEDLSGAVVNLYYGPDRTPAIALSQPGARPFPPTVGADKAVDGIFVFNVPPQSRDRVRIELDLSDRGKVVAYQGSLS